MTELVVTDSSLRLRDVSALTFVESDHGALTADLRVVGCQARVVKYPAGAQIPAHRHTRRSVKVILHGAVALTDEYGRKGEATAGMVYECDGVIYRREVLTETYLLVIDELGSRRVEAIESDV